MKREIIIKWNFIGRGNLTWQVLEEPKKSLSVSSFNLYIIDRANITFGT